MLFAKLQRILELTKDYVMKHITFQICSELFLAFQSPKGLQIDVETI